MITKICGSCNKNKTIDLFGKCRRNNDGLFYACKKCVSKNRNRETSRSYYEKNKNKQKAYYEANKAETARKTKIRHAKNPERMIDIKLRCLYGISKSDYDLMYENQNGLCKICNKKIKLVVDHNHDTKIVRGLLCSNCNQGLGLFKENQEAIKNAVNYLNGK